MVELKAIYYNGMNTEWDIISQQAEEWLHRSSGELRCTETWMVIQNSIAGIAGSP